MCIYIKTHYLAPLDLIFSDEHLEPIVNSYVIHGSIFTTAYSLVYMISFVTNRNRCFALLIIYIFLRNEKTVFALEKKHGVRMRWESGEPAFDNASRRLIVKKRQSLLFTLHRMASERIFLLELKAKYAGIE